MTNKMTNEQLSAFAEVLRMDVKKKLLDALLIRLMNGATNDALVARLPDEKAFLRDLINGLWGFDEIARVVAALDLSVEVSFRLNDPPPQLLVPPMADEDIVKMSGQFQDHARHVVVNNGPTMDHLGVWRPAPLAKIDGKEQIGDGLSADL